VNSDGNVLEPDPAPNYNIFATPAWDPSHVIDLILQDDDNLNLRDTIRMCNTDLHLPTEEATVHHCAHEPTKEPVCCDATFIPLHASIPIQPNAILHELDSTHSPPLKSKVTTRIMRQAMSSTRPYADSYRLHIDGGANMSITNEESLLINFKNIKKHPIAGVSQDAPALFATGVGYLPWKTPHNETILVRCLYSPQAAETIISPTDVAINQYTNYCAWSQHANIDTGQGYIAFHKRNSDAIIKFDLTSHNGLWYYHTNRHDDFSTCRFMDADSGIDIPTCRHLTRAAEQFLFHYRAACPGETCEKDHNKHVNDCPILRRNQFWKCPFCADGKCTYRHMERHPARVKPPSGSTESPDMPAMNLSDTANIESDAVPYSEPQEDAPPEPPDPRDIPADELRPGQMLQMDMGFARGSGFQTKDDEGRRITSLDGYNSYLLIIDRKTRRLWVFLTKSKAPPITTARDFLQKNGCRFSTRKIIRTDQGGELWRSTEFQNMVQAEHFLLQPTATDSSFQNGLAERPNRTLGNMLRCILKIANLGPEYWSWAILHAVYIKNRLPHRATGTTPYFAWTGVKPSAKAWRIFGRPVIVRLPGERSAKLDSHTTTGIFLGFTATDHNIYYRDNTTKRIKIATHVTFDEAGMTIPPAERTPAQHSAS